MSIALDVPKVENIEQQAFYDALYELSLREFRLYNNRVSLITSSTTITFGDSYLGVDSTNSITLTLPLLSSAPRNRLFEVKDETGNAGTSNITVTAAGTDKIEGSASDIISTNYGSQKYYKGETQWLKL